MSKIRKILICVLTLMSTLCLLIVGCGDDKITFVDFENKEINYSYDEIFDASQFMEVYDSNGRFYIANIKIVDENDEAVEHLFYQFTVTLDYYKIIVTVKDDETVLATREVVIRGVDNKPAYITILEMPEFGVYNTEVEIPLKFTDRSTNFNKKLIVERYVTNKVEGEYVTTLDTQNAIIKNTSDFTSNGVVFVPTKPGTYKLSVYAWDEGQSPDDARVVTRNYVIKERADSSGDVESFDTPSSIETNYHYYNSKTIAEYNELRGFGKLVYLKNQDGDYLDADGNILYKKVDETTENRIAFYKKADAQSAEYDVLAYYQDLTNYCFYDANGDEALTKEGCVTVKNADGTDYEFNYKAAVVGKDWYQELTDDYSVTKYGVIKAVASEHSYSTSLKKFYIRSSTKNNSFLKSYGQNTATGWLENPDFDYLSIWMLVKPKTTTDKTSITVYSDVSFYQTKVPIGKWFEYKISKTELRLQNYYPYDILSTNRPKDIGSYITLSNADYYGFDFYFDNIAYAKGADILIDSEALLMGQEYSIDIANAGELTKNDFNFYIGKADSETGLLQSKVNGSSSYLYSLFTTNYALLGDTYKFTPEKEGDVSCRKYYIQAMLNEQGLAKNNGEQIFATKVITASNVKVELSEHDLGQEVTINASLEGFNGTIFEYYVKKAEDSEWTTLTANKFTPNVPTAYDVKVIAKVGQAQVEYVTSKDYFKEIELSVLPASGDEKYLPNKNLTIVSSLQGSQNMQVVVKDEFGQDVTVTNNVINVSKTCKYTITASATYNGVALTKVIEIEVVGARNVQATFSVGGQLVDINNPILLNSVITINGLVDGIDNPQSSNFTYKITKLDSVQAYNVELDAVNGEFTAWYSGTYQIVVYYHEGEIINSSNVYEIVVKQDANYFNDFSDSASVWSAYKIAVTDAGKADFSYKTKTDDSGNAPNTTWHASYQGKYGVISTKPQQVELESTGGYPSVGGALSVGLRSYDYKTSAEWKNATELNQIIYNGVEAGANNVPNLAIKSNNWDYISIPIYLYKEGALANETTTLYGVYSVVLATDVPYNTWYELKLDKFYVARNYANRGIKEPFCTYNGGYPTFFLAQSRKDTAYEKNKDVLVYVDSMSFEKDATIDGYKGYSVQRFDEIGLYDANNNVVTGTNVNPYIIEYVKDSNSGVYSTSQNTTFTIKAKVNGTFVDSSKLVIAKGVRNNISYSTYYKWTASGDVATTMGGTIKAYDWYKVNVSLTTNQEGTAINAQNTATDQGAKAVSSYQLKIHYVDSVNQIVYVGYIAECFNGKDVTPV